MSLYRVKSPVFLLGLLNKVVHKKIPVGRYAKRGYMLKIKN